MKSQKNITRLLKNAAAFESKSPLFSEDELRHLLDNAPVVHPPSRVTSPTLSWRTIMFGSTMIAGATACVLWLTTQNSLENSAEQHSSMPTKRTEKYAASESAVKGSENLSTESASANDAPVGAPSHTIRLPEGEFVSTVSERQEMPNNTSQSDVINGMKIPSRIKGLEAIQLQADQLKSLGIEQTEDGYTLISTLHFSAKDPVALTAFSSNSGSDQRTLVLNQNKLLSLVKNLGYTEENAELLFRVSIDSFHVSSRLENASTVRTSKLSPMLITHESKDASGIEQNAVLLYGNSDHNASQHSKYGEEVASLFDLYSQHPIRSQDSLQHFPLLSKLIPVRLVMLDAKGQGADVVLWYYPTDEFVKALPKKFGDQVRSERDRLTTLEERVRTDSTKTLLSQRFSGDYRYTDVTRGRNGSIELLSVGPNPARDQATIRYRLSDERNISFVLYDMSGSRVSVLSTLNSQHSGDSEETIDCSQLSSGAYLLSIVSDRQEQVIQRFIIQK